MCHVVASIGFRYDVNSEFNFITGVFVLSQGIFIAHLTGQQPFFSEDWNQLVNMLRQRLNNPVDLRVQIVSREAVNEIDDFRRRIEALGNNS